MATASPSLIRLSEQEYLALDRENDYRSEYIHGTTLAMAGSTLRHSAVAGNCGALLNEKLTGRGCIVFNSDARVRTPSSGLYVYPDVSVVAGSPLTFENSNDILVNPGLVIEVLSPSTKNFDCNAKFALYREIESVKEYLLIHTDAITVEHFCRQSDDSWIYRETKNPSAAIFVPSLEITLPLEKIYGNSMTIPG